MELNGLSQRQIFFNYNLLKGRIAENIIEQLFLALNFKVYRFGIENAIPDFKLLLENSNAKNNGKIIEKIKNTPDYFIYSEELGMFLIEVKYRSKGILELDKFKDFHFPMAHIILVTPDAIKITTAKEIEKQLKSKNEDQSIFDDLYDTKLIKFNDEQKIIIKQFCKYVEYFLSNLPNNKVAHKTISQVQT